MKKERAAEVRARVVKGIRPGLPPPFDEISNEYAGAFRSAIEACLEWDPVKRATSKQVALIFLRAHEALLAKWRQEQEDENDDDDEQR